MLEREAARRQCIRTLPLAADRYEEAVHFAELAIAVAPEEGNLAKANWYFGAHLSATLGIVEAARCDFANAGLSGAGFQKTPIAGECYLTPDHPDPWKNDPLALSRAYKEMRNVRTHYGTSLIVAEPRFLLQDAGNSSSAAAAPVRWFLGPVDRYPLPKDPLLRPEDRTKLNNWLQHRMLADVVGQFLVSLERTLEASCKLLPTRTLPH